MTEPAMHTGVHYRKKALPLSLVRKILVGQQDKRVQAFIRELDPRLVPADDRARTSGTSALPHLRLNP